MSRPKKKKPTRSVSPKAEAGTIGIAQQKRAYLGNVGWCRPDECPMADQCTYNVAEKVREQPDRYLRCTVETNYLMDIWSNWIDPKKGIGNLMTDMHFEVLNNQIILMHSMLIRLVKELYALEKYSYRDHKGNVRIYPQLKEIRDTLKAIDFTIHNYGFDEMWYKKFGKIKKVSAPSVKEIMEEYGDPTLYDDIVKGL